MSFEMDASTIKNLMSSTHATESLMSGTYTAGQPESSEDNTSKQQRMAANITE